MSGCAGGPRNEAGGGLTWLPASAVVANLPREMGGSTQYQDYGGPGYLVRAAPAWQETGGERIPDFSAVTAPPIGGGGDNVLMPNGSGRPVQSLNSLASPP
jgi:hypothetical protein